MPKFRDLGNPDARLDKRFRPKTGGTRSKGCKPWGGERRPGKIHRNGWFEGVRGEEERNGMGARETWSQGSENHSKGKEIGEKGDGKKKP